METYRRLLTCFHRIHHPEILKKEKHGKTITKPSRSTKAKFPIDFFEHCNPTNEVEYGGSDLLEVYNVNQIKARLSTNGMYLANTKVRHSVSMYLYVFGRYL